MIRLFNLLHENVYYLVYLGISAVCLDCFVHVPYQQIAHYGSFVVSVFVNDHLLIWLFLSNYFSLLWTFMLQYQIVQYHFQRKINVQ